MRRRYACTARYDHEDESYDVQLVKEESLFADYAASSYPCVIVHV